MAGRSREPGVSLLERASRLLRALGVQTRTQAVLAVSQMTHGATTPGWRRSGQ